MDNGQRVLVVNGLTETAEVLKAVLEPRGLHVDRVQGGTSGSANAPDAPPRVVVLHEEDGDRNAHAEWDGVPRVVIGSADMPSADRNAADRQHLPSPFRYGELVRAIENLLDESPAA